MFFFQNSEWKSSNLTTFWPLSAPASTSGLVFLEAPWPGQDVKYLTRWRKLGKLPASPGASVVLRTGLRTTSAMEKNTSYNPYQKGGEKTRHKHTVIRNSRRNSMKQPCGKNLSTPRPPECLRRSDLAFPQPSRCWWLLCKWFTVYNPHVAADIP